MMEQWSLERRTLACPDAIILNTNRAMKQFRECLKRLQHDYLREEIGHKEVRVLESVIQALQFDKRVEMEVRFGAMDVLRAEFGIEDRDDLAVVTDAVLGLAYDMYSELVRLGAYQNSYLFYQYHSLVGQDVVMVRIVPPTI